MRRRARTDLCGGRSVRIVPTAPGTQFGLMSDLAEITGQYFESVDLWRDQELIFLSVEFLQEAGPRFLPASWRISAGSGTRVRRRSSLSQCRPGTVRLPPAGPTTATRSSYADARFANRIRSWGTDGGASKRTMSTTIGSGSGGVAARSAAGRLLFFLCSLCPTRTSACWLVVRRCGGGLWNTARGKSLRRS